MIKEKDPFYIMFHSQDIRDVIFMIQLSCGRTIRLLQEFFCPRTDTKHICISQVGQTHPPPRTTTAPDSLREV